MRQIEDDLKAALKRKAAPPGFEERLFERLETGAFNHGRRRRRVRFWVLAAAAMIALTCGIGIFQYQNHIRARNEAALERTLTALSIASIQLDRAEKKAFERFSDRLSRLAIDQER